MDIKITLEAARVNAGYTQQQAADIGGVSRAQIQTWENGKSKPNKLELYGLASVYKIPVDALLLPEEIALN